MVKRRKCPLVTLPQELCNDILTRLPTKTLLRCRSVSKSWCLLIDDPYFSSTHFQKSKNNQNKSHLLVLEPPNMHKSKQSCTIRSVDKFRKMSEVEIDITWHEHHHALGYINGLVFMKKYIKETLSHQIFLWNPSIRKALELPIPPMSFFGTRFDIDYAFGFDQTRNDYKVVASLCQRDGFHVQGFVEIFTLSTWSWKSVLTQSEPCYWVQGSPKVFLDGIIYWSGVDIAKATPQGRFTHFVSFNVFDEVFKYINLPYCEIVKTNVHERFPIIMDQSIALMEIFETHSHIWVVEGLEGMEHSWTKRYTIDLQLLHKYLYFTMDGEVLYAGDKGGVNSYNIKSQETKVLAKSYRLSPLFTTVYMESLVLLKGIGSKNLIQFPTFKLE